MSSQAGTVQNRLDAELERRQAMLEAAVRLMRPAIEALLDLRKAGFAVALKLDAATTSRAIDIIGLLECPCLATGATPDAVVRYQVSVRQPLQDGRAQVTVSTDDGAEYEDPSWSETYHPEQLAEAIVDAAVGQRLASTGQGGGFQL